MTTIEAFNHLISQPGWHKITGTNASTARSLKANHKIGLVSNDKMRELLIKAGYKNKPEVWKVK